MILVESVSKYTQFHSPSDKRQIFWRRSFPSNLYFSIFGLAILITLFLFYQQGFSACSNISKPISRSWFSFLIEDSTQKLFQPDDYTLSVRQTINNFKDLRLPQNSSNVRPFLRAKSFYRFAPKYNLSACIIEKAACTLTQSIFCYLYDPVGFVQNNRTIPAERWNGRFCENRNELPNSHEKHLHLPSNPPTIFMVRDPIERFLSGFTEKCYNALYTCYDCNKDIFCVVEKFHEEILKLNAEHWNVTIPKNKHVNQTPETQHMAPANWMCDLFDESDNFIFVKYGETPETLQEMYNKLKNIYLAFGVEEEHVDFVIKSINGTSSNGTKSQEIRKEYSAKLKSSPKHLQLLKEIYEYDYKLFGISPL